MKTKIKKVLYNGLKKFEKTYHALLFTMVVLSANISPVYASSTPKLISGTVDLLRTATTWLLLIIPVGAGFFLGYHALQKSLSEDQAVIAEKNKLMKNVLIGAAIAETASGLVTIFLGFYQ